MKPILLLLLLSLCFGHARAQIPTMRPALYQKVGASGGPPPFVVYDVVYTHTTSQYSSTPTGYAQTWNMYQPATWGAGVLAKALVDSLGASTGLTLNIDTAFGGSSDSYDTPVTPNTGLFTDQIEKGGINTMGTDVGAGVTLRSTFLLSGCNPLYKYQIYAYVSGLSWQTGTTTVVANGISSGGITAADNFGSSANTYLNSTSVVWCKNVAPDGSNNIRIRYVDPANAVISIVLVIRITNTQP